jgi:hypothetical protein
LETEDHVLKAEHFDQIKSCLIRDDLHMRVHLHSKGHLLTPVLKEMRWTRAKCPLQWHAKNGHKNILFTDEKILTFEEQYNQYNKIHAHSSLEVRSEVAGRSSPFLRYGLVGGVPSGGDPSSFLQEKGGTGIRVYQEYVLQRVVKHLNVAFFGGQEWVLQQDSVPAQKAKTTQEWLQRNILAFISAKNWLLGSAYLKPWTKNCVLFWRTRRIKSITTA